MRFVYDRRGLRTARLSARPFAWSDWGLVHALQNDPATGPWLRGPFTPPSEARSREIAAKFAASWARDRVGPYVWRLGESNVGYAGLRVSRLGMRDELEVLWAILPQHQNQGFATEAAGAAIAADGGRSALVSWTLPDNRASQRVMEKLGFAYANDMVWADLPHVVYRRAARMPAGDAA